MAAAEVEAEQIVVDFGLELPISPQTLCATLSTKESPIDYREELFQTTSLCGISLSHNGKIKVVVNSNITDQGRKNFTGAHEIGHVIYHIQKGKASSFKCTTSDISGGATKVFEKEANEFASALLMPRSLIDKSVFQGDLSWKLIQDLQHKCKTSLIATAIRTVTISKESCALIIHKNGGMWTPTKSSSFNSYIETIPFPQYLERSSEFIGADLPDDMHVCDTIDWINNPKYLPDTILYSSIHNNEYDRTMTLLLVPELYEDDEDTEWEEPKLK